ncbi:MAG TPA: hypothetical protein VJ749_16830, partial [Pyrinomonadaceae bacterium]|nr:hypothetical protein [Pyrinomonadaceae bacterium]
VDCQVARKQTENGFESHLAFIHFPWLCCGTSGGIGGKYQQGENPLTPGLFRRNQTRPTS